MPVKKESSHAELAGLARDKSASCADNLESQPQKNRRLSEHAAPEGAAISSYRCYFLDAANHVAADRFVECGTDGLVQARADELLADTAYPAMEIWDGARFVYQAMRHSGRHPRTDDGKGGQTDPRPPISTISRPMPETEE